MNGYSPRTEPDVVLGCGCVVQGWPQIYIIGKGSKLYGICETHTDGPGKWGLQRILREASVYERIQFREYGTPAPKRRSKRTHTVVPNLPGQPNQTARVKSQPNGQASLF